MCHNPEKAVLLVPRTRPLARTVVRVVVGTSEVLVFRRLWRRRRRRRRRLRWRARHRSAKYSASVLAPRGRPACQGIRVVNGLDDVDSAPFFVSKVGVLEGSAARGSVVCLRSDFRGIEARLLALSDGHPWVAYLGKVDSFVATFALCAVVVVL